MTNLSIMLPLVAAISVAAAVTGLHRMVPPRLAARCVAVTMVVVVVAALPTVWILSLAFLAHTPFVGTGFEWCVKAFGVHQGVPVAIGLPALIVAASGFCRVVGTIRANRRLRHDAPGSVEVAGHDRPFAFTMPGRGGHIVLSSALVDLLDDEEREVVVAHEAAHGRHRHDRYLLIANITAAAVPFLRPLASRLEFSLERWADEAAVAQCGDRRFVARTLGKVALGHAAPRGALTFAGLGVAARVAALLAPPVRQPRRPLVVGLWSAIATTGLLALFQIHHLGGLTGALCPG